MSRDHEIDFAAERYSLTPAEARLAFSIASGETLQVIAGRHGVSLHTVRNQLKSVFSKTGVTRQVELVLLINKIR